MEVSNVDKQKAKEIDVLIKGTFGTELGQKCLAHLKKTFVDRAVYVPGLTFEETAFREGERSVIMKLMKEVSNGN